MALELIATINLDMAKPNAEKVYAMQYDSADRIKAQLLNSGVKWQVPSGAIAIVSYKKSDRIGGYYDTTEFKEAAVTIDSDRSIVIITLSPQVTTTSGNVSVNVSFVQNGKRLSTFSFLLQVNKALITADNIESKWFVSLLASTGVTVDTSLSIFGAAADAKTTGNLLDTKVNLPAASRYGQSGQLLRTNGDGTTTWVSEGTPTDAQTNAAVGAWLIAHPEATTTIQDDSITTSKIKNNQITEEKLSSNIINKFDALKNFRRTNCNLVLIGDSWTVGGSASSADKRYSSLLCNMLDCTEFNFGVGGAGYTRPNTFLSQIEAANSSMSDDEKANTGIIAIIGGVNDINHMSDTTISDFKTAALACVRKAHECFPDALIVIGLSNTRNDLYNDTMIHWIQSTMDYLQVNSQCPMLFIKNLGASVNGVTSNYISDRLHLSDVGHAKFAAHIANAILGGGQDVFYYIGLPTLDASVASAATAIHIFRDNNIIRLTPGALSFKSALTVNTLIGTLPDSVLAPRANIYVPTYRGDKLNGSIAFTSSGNIRFVPDPNFNNDTTGAYFPGITWIFNGGG